LRENDFTADGYAQGTGAVYILVSIPILLVQRRRRQQSEAARRQLQGSLLSKGAAKPGPPSMD
jgi:hypothetical protein